MLDQENVKYQNTQHILSILITCKNVRITGTESLGQAQHAVFAGTPTGYYSVLGTACLQFPEYKIPKAATKISHALLFVYAALHTHTHTSFLSQTSMQL